MLPPSFNSILKGWNTYKEGGLVGIVLHKPRREGMEVGRILEAEAEFGEIEGLGEGSIHLIPAS